MLNPKISYLCLCLYEIITQKSSCGGSFLVVHKQFMAEHSDMVFSSKFALCFWSTFSIEISTGMLCIYISFIYICRFVFLNYYFIYFKC